MIFGCDRCGRRYSVPDERVQGRAFRVTCKSCGNVIVVRPAAAPDPAPQASAGPPDVPDPFAAAPPPAPAVARPPSSPRPAPGPTAAVPRPDGPTVAAARPPAMPSTPAPRRAAAEDPSRSLTTAEMAWMSADDAGRAADAPEPQPGPEIPAAEPEAAPVKAAAGRKRPSLPRIVLAAVLLGLAVAAVVAFVVWPGLRSKPPPAPKPVVATPVPPPAPPPPPVAPPVVAAPEPAPTPAPEPPKAAPAPRAGPRARFEPGTVQVGRVARKEEHRLNRKDRRLLDLLARKHDQAAPPEKIEKLDLDTARSLDPAAVERVMEENQGAFSGCVTRAAKVAGLADARRATLLLTVAGSGQVSTAWVAEADLSRTGLGRCLVGAARRLVFPAFEGEPVDVSVPLMLEAR